MAACPLIFIGEDFGGEGFVDMDICPGAGDVMGTDDVIGDMTLAAETLLL